MFTQILTHTPIWVWIVLAVLVKLGLSQTKPHDVSLVRVTILPLVMLALSASGVLSAFGYFPVALGGWAAGVGIALIFARNAIAVRGATWSTETQKLHLPGNWVPLALMMGIFATKFLAGISLAMEPALATHVVFAGLCSLAYGAFSGLFLGRGLYLRSLATHGMRLRSA
jgi:hypothetical protein